MTEKKTSKDRCKNFVNYLFAQFESNKGLKARMRRADNPATEYQSWETLANFSINLEFEAERLPFALIGASIAKSDHKMNGVVKLGTAIAKSFEEGNKSDQANARLRRLLACHDVEETCRILRSLLTMIQDRVKEPLDYASLLQDLCWFNHSPQKVKARWAQQFYRNEEEQKDNA